MPAVEKKEFPQFNTPYDFKLSPFAASNGYESTIDGDKINVYPEHYQEIKTTNGQSYPGPRFAPKTIVTNVKTGKVTECEGGFKELTPKQVYELTCAGIITPSKKRNHMQIIKDYLKANVVNIDPEDY